jgi:hypothetical protein
VPGYSGALREEGRQLPGVDQGGLHPAVVSASASSIPFEIVCKRDYGRSLKPIRLRLNQRLPSRADRSSAYIAAFGVVIAALIQKLPEIITAIAGNGN